jgi:hypothetical protein
MENFSFIDIPFLSDRFSGTMAGQRARNGLHCRCTVMRRRPESEGDVAPGFQYKLDGHILIMERDEYRYTLL